MKKHLINTLKILGYTVLVLGFILGYSVKGIREIKSGLGIEDDKKI